MRISPILSTSAQAGIKTRKNQAPSASQNNVSFKTAKYQDVLYEFWRSNFKNRKEIYGLFDELIKSLLSPNIKMNPTFYHLPRHDIDWFLIKLNKLIPPQQSILAETNSGKPLVVFEEGSIFFMDPEMSEDPVSLHFELDDKKEVIIEVGNSCNMDIYKFHRFSDVLKRKTHISGSGIGQTSESTYYDRDGKEREFRTFLSDIFGI